MIVKLKRFIINHMKGLFKVLHWLKYCPIQYGHLETTSRIGKGVKVYNKKNLFMYENTNINEGAVIMNTRAKFVMKKYSGAAIGLTVITGAHLSVVGRWRKFITDKDKDILDKNGDYDKDVVVEDDVWLASNVTLLSGVTIGRGAVVGAGAVVRNNVPPYAIVVGNPAKIVGFQFTPSEIIEHEKGLYPEEERLSMEFLERNYSKYFLKRIKEIKNILS